MTNLISVLWILIQPGFYDNKNRYGIGIFIQKSNVCGSVTFRYGSGSISLTSGSGSCFSPQWLTRSLQKVFFSKIFCLLLFEGTFTTVLIDKKSTEVTRYQKSRFFLIFCLLMKDPDPGQYKIMKRIRILEAPKTCGSGTPQKSDQISSSSFTYCLTKPYCSPFM